MRRPRAALSVLAGLAIGVGGETLLVVQRQCRSIEEGLREDFRVVLFLKDDADDARLKVLEEQLRALPDVDDVRAVGKQEQLSALRREEPEVVDAVALVGGNPLTPAFEVRLAEGGVSRVAQWLAQAQPLADWGDARYKPAQLQAILQARFYSRFLDLDLAALVCLGAALALWGLWHTRQGSVPVKTAVSSAGLCALASGAGAALVALLVAPLRGAVTWWAWPSFAAQAALLLGAAATGWILCARHD